MKKTLILQILSILVKITRFFQSLVEVLIYCGKKIINLLPTGSNTSQQEDQIEAFRDYKTKSQKKKMKKKLAKQATAERQREETGEKDDTQIGTDNLNMVFEFIQSTKSESMINRNDVNKYGALITKVLRYTIKLDTERPDIIRIKLSELPRMKIDLRYFPYQVYKLEAREELLRIAAQQIEMEAIGSKGEKISIIRYNLFSIAQILSEQIDNPLLSYIGQKAFEEFKEHQEQLNFSLILRQTYEKLTQENRNKFFSLNKNIFSDNVAMERIARITRYSKDGVRSVSIITTKSIKENENTMQESELEIYFYEYAINIKRVTKKTVVGISRLETVAIVVSNLPQTLKDTTIAIDNETAEIFCYEHIEEIAREKMALFRKLTTKNVRLDIEN